MSENKATPGPWRVAGKQTIRAGNEWIGKANWRNGENNARLIAAAPDLYKAAKHLSVLADEIWVQLSDPEATMMRSAYADLDAALAKAEGKAP